MQVRGHTVLATLRGPGALGSAVGVLALRVESLWGMRGWEAVWREGEGVWREGEGVWREGEGVWREGEGVWREGEGVWRGCAGVVEVFDGGCGGGVQGLWRCWMRGVEGV